MFLRETSTIAVEALRTVFDSAHPVTEYQGLWVSIEFPMAKANYPGIWVEFETTAPLQTAGIDHKEVAADGQGVEREVRRWRFAGRLMFTVAAMTTGERDKLADELIKVLASGMANPRLARFRQAIEHNDLIGLQPNWDRMDPSSPSSGPGTPWGSDEYIFDRTITMEVQGEFVSDPAEDESPLVPLSAVKVYHRAEGEPWPEPMASGDGWI